ncbi:MAG TPA: vWA domain-containing protein [Chthoniobacterales bacterium]|nr:vWA domain-containing protein [Chthoniobacterales bacterium]
MNKRHTEIVFTLDRSGSMASCRDATIEGFNRFLREQQAVPGRAKLTLVLFNNIVIAPFESIPVEETLPLTRRSYLPSGPTALLDAIGSTIAALRARVKRLGPINRPPRVIVAILTDGHENASREYRWADVSAQIDERQRAGWTFLFLGANQDAIATAARMNISAEHAANYVATPEGTRDAAATLSRTSSILRQIDAETDAVDDSNESEEL